MQPPIFNPFSNFTFNFISTNNSLNFPNNNLMNFLSFYQFLQLNNLNINKEIKRHESLDVKSDVDRIMLDNKKLKEKDKDTQTIIDIIPFTIVESKPKTNAYRCAICLSNFEIGEKVSALPCCHTYHTECLDKWLVEHLKCPVCNFNLTFRNVVGSDYIKERLEKVRKEIKEIEEKMMKEKLNNNQ